MTEFELASLRIAAFAAMRGWGVTREDGKWSAWNGNELREQADNLVAWAMKPETLGTQDEGDEPTANPEGT